MAILRLRGSVIGIGIGAGLVLGAAADVSYDFKDSLIMRVWKRYYYSQEYSDRMAAVRIREEYKTQWYKENCPKKKEHFTQEEIDKMHFLCRLKYGLLLSDDPKAEY